MGGLIMIYVPKLPGSGLSKRAPGFPPVSHGLAQTDLALACGLSSTQADGPVHSGGHTVRAILLVKKYSHVNFK